MDKVEDLSFAERFSNEVELINGLAASTLSTVIDAVLDFLATNSKSDDFQQSLSEFAAETR